MIGQDLPGVCRRVVPRARFLPGVPEAPGSPQLLVEALHPVEAGAGSQGAQQGGAGGDGGPDGQRRRRSGGSETGQHQSIIIDQLIILIIII